MCCSLKLKKKLMVQSIFAPSVFPIHFILQSLQHRCISPCFTTLPHLWCCVSCSSALHPLPKQFGRHMIAKRISHLLQKKIPYICNTDSITCLILLLASTLHSDFCPFSSSLFSAIYQFEGAVRPQFFFITQGSTSRNGTIWWLHKRLWKRTETIFQATAMHFSQASLN